MPELWGKDGVGGEEMKLKDFDEIIDTMAATPNCDFVQAILIMSKAPTIDAVPVVRCKDCLWSRKVDDREPKYTCKNICHYGCTQWLGSDDYCSYGEPKEDEEK